MNSNHYRKLLKQHGAQGKKADAKQVSALGKTSGITNVSRRGFLAGVGAGALVLAVGLPNKGFGADAPKYAGAGMGNGLRDDVKLFVAIGPDGTVTITNIRAEMGQGIRTGIAIVIADEMEADMSKVKVVQAVGNEVKYGNQDTDGSRSTRHHFMAWRKVGASARAMLEKAAADKWGVPVSKVEAKNHEVVEKGGTRKASYGELADAASAMAAPDKVTLKSPKAFRYIGKSTNKLIDGMAITTGKAVYGQDVRLDGMLYAVIARAPVHGGKIASVDSSATMNVPGVKKVVNIDPAPIPGAFQPKGGVAVIATNTWSAMKGRDALKVTWDNGPNASFNSDSYRSQLEAAVKAPGKVVRQVGNVDSALSSAKKKVTADYYIPMLAHVPMESPAATARVANGKAEIWACCQGPQAGVDNVAQRLGIPKENVTVNQTLLGGGFGRKSKVDFLVEAALLSKAMDGTPVKVVWTREDDLQHDYYHAVSAEHLEAGLDDAGKVTGWLHRSAAPSIFSIFMPDPKHEQPLELGMGLVDTPFNIANMRMENPEAAAQTRIGWFRAVYNVPHAFAIQSFAAEVAAAAGKDQKDYLLELLGPARKMNNHTELADSWNYGEDPAKYPYETARLRGVIELAAKQAGWGKKLPAGEGMGIAAHRSFATYTAAVFHVKVDKGVLTIPRVDVAVDCGPQVNPDRVKAMMEGSAIMGVAIATQGEITFKDGATQQGNFDSFQVTRMNGAPKQIFVHSVPAASYDMPMGGAGEPGLPPIAPALCNAIFAATGKRIRVLPIRDQLA